MKLFLIFTSFSGGSHENTIHQSFGSVVDALEAIAVGEDLSEFFNEVESLESGEDCNFEFLNSDWVTVTCQEFSLEKLVFELPDVYYDVDDPENEMLKVSVEFDKKHGLLIGAEGYGMSKEESGGHPISIQYHNERLEVLTWGDINQEECTEIISLHGAKESLRTIHGSD